MAAGLVPRYPLLIGGDGGRFPLPGPGVLSVGTAAALVRWRPIKTCSIEKRKSLDIDINQAEPIVCAAFALPGKQQQVPCTGQSDVPETDTFAALFLVFFLLDRFMARARKSEYLEVDTVVATPVKKVSSVPTFRWALPIGY